MISNCVEVDFFLQDVPPENADVVIEVTVTGHCTHMPGEEGNSSNFERRGRRLSGIRRLLVMHASTPSKEYHRELAGMPSTFIRPDF